MAKTTSKKSTAGKKSNKKQTPANQSSHKEVRAVRSRKLKSPQYKTFRMSHRIKSPKSPVVGSFRLFARSIRLLRQHKKLFGGIVLVYLVLTVILVKGFGSSLDVSSIKSDVLSLYHGQTAQLGAGLTIFALLLGSANSPSSDVAGAYQSMLLVIVSLVLIWALRQVLAGVKVGVRDAYYNGLTPVIPFLLVLIVIAIQFIPLLVANFLFSAVFSGGIAVTLLEKTLWGLLLLLLITWSLYMVTSSIFALYIVTLPDMRPMQALRSARGLVRFRRWTIMRRVLFLPFALIFVAAIIMLPVIIWLSPLAEWLFFVLTMCGLAVIHSYMYNLYRELL